LYRALHLLADVAQGRVVQTLAREGGLTSTLWAGPENISRSMKSGVHAIQGTRRKEPSFLRLGFASDDFGYAIDLGLPIKPPATAPTAFDKDPQIKRECGRAGELLRPSTLLVDRLGMAVKARDETNDWAYIKTQISAFDSMMAVAFLRSPAYRP
jgi:predicted ATPase